MNAHEIAKALLNLPSKNLSLNSSMDTTGMAKYATSKKNIIGLKYLLRNFTFTQFEINCNQDNTKYSNVSMDVSKSQSDNNLKRKITKLLDQRKHKDEILIPPTEYYDDNLNLVIDAKEYRNILPKIHSNKNFGH
jgi:hypothetical protein